MAAALIVSSPERRRTTSHRMTPRGAAFSLHSSRPRGAERFRGTGRSDPLLRIARRTLPSPDTGAGGERRYDEAHRASQNFVGHIRPPRFAIRQCVAAHRPLPHIRDPWPFTPSVDARLRTDAAFSRRVLSLSAALVVRASVVSNARDIRRALFRAAHRAPEAARSRSRARAPTPPSGASASARNASVPMSSSTPA